MDDYIWIIILAFVAGFMLQDMMKNICGGRLVEGITFFGDDCTTNSDCFGRKICTKGFHWKECKDNCESTDQCGGRDGALQDVPEQCAAIVRDGPKTCMGTVTVGGTCTKNEDCDESVCAGAGQRQSVGCSGSGSDRVCACVGY
jgi:hypothetical protein